MKPLDKDLRDKLARVVEEAREVAETAARYTLQQLSIGESSPYKHLSAEERDLRRRLRAHGRQLGDTRKPRDETQEIERLLEEVAYQHWHRMLFAKFLAENNLLMYPDPVSPVPVSLEECEELARDEGAKNGWELASRFAQNMLPQIFRADSPVFEIDLAPEYQRRLEYLLGELPSEVFEASDSLGWVYQFWQSKRKKEINESEVKIGARELPAVTQLFTEPYMVSFLLDNSIGAWWAARTLSDCDLLTADSEEELRRRASVPRVSLEYLRFSKDEAGKWWPAAGSQDNWPNKLSELKCLDPCCGSGHFLVGILLMLVPLRMRLEGMTANKAVDAVIADNLYGLELDQRCVQLAVFALALEAWRYPEAGGYRTLPSFNIACSGLAPNSTREQWKQIAARIKGDLYPMTAKTSVADARVASYEQFETGMAKLYDLFSDAPTLGSLINPTKIQGDLYSASFEQISELLGLVLEKEECNSEYYEMGITAQGLSEAAKILSSQFHLIITNVPYLKSGYHDDTLKDYCERHYHIGKYDLATVFLQRIQEMLADNGLSCLVMPQNWLSLTYYKQLRLHHLENSRFLLIANLGAGAFETISGEVVKVGLVMMSNATSAENAQHIGFELDSSTDIPAKMKNLAYGRFHIAEQSRHLGNPDSRISFELSGFDDDLLMNKYCTPNTGLQTGDLPRYAFMFWEVPRIKKPWVLFQGTPDKTTYFGGRTQIIRWENNGRELAQTSGAVIRGLNCVGKQGILVHRMSNLPATLYSGEIFDQGGAVIVPKKSEYLTAMWCYLSSPEYRVNVRKLDKKIGVTPATLVKVPFDYEFWEKEAAYRYPNGLPQPLSGDPTQWIFHGHPANCSLPLQVAILGLLGYRWPAEMDPKMVLSDVAREWISKSKELDHISNENGLLCIPSVRGERAAVDRLVSILAEAYGSDWSTAKLSGLLAEADHSGGTLESWLRDKFFVQHFKLFGHRPFIWQIWDGLSDGFSVLVNYHKLDRRKLETLIYTYLGDWILRQKSDIVLGVDGAQERLDAAESLKQKLELILVGEAPHDIFVRWKPIEDQPIGWEPDINDGVRINIRPFMTVGDVRKKGAGVLRDKPNIKWGKDRGKDVESAPWYHIFGADRINDHHLTIAEKQAAREAAKKVNKR